MEPIIPILNETSAAVIHLGHHLRLLREVLSRIDRDLEIDARDFADLIEDLSRSPTAVTCGWVPRQPVLNACDAVIFDPDPTMISVENLAAVAERAVVWCDAIRDALGDPVVFEPDGPSNP